MAFYLVLFIFSSCNSSNSAQLEVERKSLVKGHIQIHMPTRVLDTICWFYDHLQNSNSNRNMTLKVLFYFCIQYQCINLCLVINKFSNILYQKPIQLIFKYLNNDLLFHLKKKSYWGGCWQVSKSFKWNI